MTGIRHAALVASALILALAALSGDPQRDNDIRRKKRAPATLAGARKAPNGLVQHRSATGVIA